MSTFGMSQYGFEWDQVEVTRISEFNGQKSIEIRSGNNWVTIYISPTGRSIRVFHKNHQEMKVLPK